MSETPRTNLNVLTVETIRTLPGTGVQIVLAAVMRTMERELNAMTEERDELREEVKSLKESIRDQEHHIMELERLRRYAPGPHMGQD